MLAKTISYGLNGISGYMVAAEIDVHTGLPGVDVVGLPDAAVKESRDRVKSAVKNSGYRFSPLRITVNLAPADTKKEGSFYDLPIAVGILLATEQLAGDFSSYVMIGELSLDGQLRHINGILPMIISAKENGFKNFIIPKANASEARYIQGVNIYALECLRDIEQLTADSPVLPIENANIAEVINNTRYREDFKWVKGQRLAKRALEIAAAGGHNVLMSGPPGGGKTMMAKCIPSILPDLTSGEALETTKIHSVAGMLDERFGIVSHRPFRSPHHTASRVALTGGGAWAKPGEISLAHNGVLFLDELAEYPRSVLEILRQPLEDGVITVSRAQRIVQYPANFMLVASMNPCPCGNYGSKTAECTCSPAQIQKYNNRISGPLLDRIDLHINVDSVTYDDLKSEGVSESSADIKLRVNAARALQLERFENEGIYSNCKMSSAHLKRYCALDARGEEVLKSAFERFGFSARAHSRILKVARTIADLDGCRDISAKHISEAIMYRRSDNE